jgi:hypothetical protein
MIRTGRLVLAMLILTGAAPAFAQQWHVASVNGEAPDRTVYFVDAAFRRTGTIVRFSTQSIFESLTDGRDFDRSVTQRRGNCATMSSAIMRNEYYARGRLLSSDPSPGSEIRHSEGTILYGVMQIVCGARALDGSAVATPEANARAYFNRADK